jgi:hypothetical protein
MTQADRVHSTPPTNTSSETLHTAPTGLARRAFVTALAGGAAAAIVAPAASLAAGETDPIFAAIEKHRQLGVAFEAKLTEQSELERVLPDELTRSCLSYHTPTIVETDAPEWIAAERAVHAIHDAESVAICEMAGVVPTTLAGVGALLSYAAEYSKRGFDWPDLESGDGRSGSFENYVMRNCAEALESFVVTSARNPGANQGGE